MRHQTEGLEGRRNRSLYSRMSSRGRWGRCPRWTAPGVLVPAGLGAGLARVALVAGPRGARLSRLGWGSVKEGT